MDERNGDTDLHSRYPSAFRRTSFPQVVRVSLWIAPISLIFILTRTVYGRTWDRENEKPRPIPDCGAHGCALLTYIRLRTLAALAGHHAAPASRKQRRVGYELNAIAGVIGQALPVGGSIVGTWTGTWARMLTGPGAPRVDSNVTMITARSISVRSGSNVQIFMKTNLLSPSSLHWRFCLLPQFSKAPDYKISGVSQYQNAEPIRGPKPRSADLGSATRVRSSLLRAQDSVNTPESRRRSA